MLSFCFSLLGGGACHIYKNSWLMIREPARARHERTVRTHQIPCLRDNGQWSGREWKSNMGKFGANLG